MAIACRCPHCGAEMSVDDFYAGQLGACRSCNRAMTAPGSPAQASRPVVLPRERRPVAVAVMLVFFIGLGLLGVVGLLTALVVPMVASYRDSVQRGGCTNNLRRIGMALHQYQNDYGTFPPAYVADERGIARHSWRVLILPYLGEQTLYDQYDFSEAWDGPNNARLAARMPAVFACPADAQPGKTNYFVVAGPGAVFDRDKSVESGQIRDSTGATLLVVEAVGAGVGWTQPRDLDGTQMSMLINTPGGSEISSLHDGGAMVLFADGSVRFLVESFDPDVLRGMTTIAGGEGGYVPK